VSKEVLFRRIMRVSFPAIGKSYTYKGTGGFWIEFSIPFGTNSASNLGEVVISNLTMATISELKRGDPIIVEAGYEGTIWQGPNLQGLISGEIEKVEVTWDGVDKAVKIEIGDSHDQWLTKRVNKDWEPGTKVRKVVKDLCKASGFGQGTIEIPGRDNFEYETGFITAANETIKSALEKCVADLLEIKNATYEVHVESGLIHFHREGVGTVHSGVLISAEHGLIGHVEPLAIEEPNDPESDAPLRQYSCQVLLDPRLGADKLVDLQDAITTSGDVKTLKIVEGSHVGTPTKDFVTKLTLQELEE